MKALVLRGHGDFSQLAIADRPTPVIQRGGDVLVRLKAAALNHLDLWTVRGLPGLALEFPHILGGDGAGVVEAIGRDVTRLAPGDAVMLNPGVSCYRCDTCLAGEHSLCPEYRLLGEHLDGTLAEYLVVPEQNVLPIPQRAVPGPVTFVEAAAYSLVTLTAWRMLVTRAKVRPGETVLIWGIGGGVAGAALQIAKRAGAYVIVTSSSDAKLERARALGADVTLNHTVVDVPQEVRRITERRGADVIVESVGAATWERSLRMLARRGRLVTCGATTGPAVTVDVRRMFWYQWNLLGSTMGNAAEYREIVALLGRDALRPLVDSVFPFADAIGAFERLAGADHMGKIVVELPS